MDKRAFTDFALAEMEAVHRLAAYLSKHDADDLVQETYLRAFRAMDTYTPTEYGIRSWLFKILHNVLYDRLSKEQRHRAALDGFREEQGSSLPVDRSAATSEVDWEQVDGRLWTAIEALPLHQKTVFLLSALEGMRYREIAAVTDIPIGTVMSRLSRARTILASQLVGVAAERRLPTSSTVEPAARDSAEDRDTQGVSTTSGDFETGSSNQS